MRGAISDDAKCTVFKIDVNVTIIIYYFMDMCNTI